MRMSLFASICMLVAPIGIACGQPAFVESQGQRLEVTTVADGLEHPWAIALLPDGAMLVTERSGRLRLVSREGEVSKPVAGVPPVFAQRQGGLLDVVLDPGFATNSTIYLSYAEPGDRGASTAVARARFDRERLALERPQVIFRQEPKMDGGGHFGSRMVFAPDGKLFVTTGERFKFDPAQDLSGHLGKVLRINPDGSVPQDNPFVGRDGARPEIWSYGHRNSQGAAIHPSTGALWMVEHGPRGGDELNIAARGRNYGWPLVSWGQHYNGQDIPDPPTRPDLAPSIHQWTPVISPSGMAFYTADLIPAWRGNLLIGGLSGRVLVRLTLDGDRVTGEERHEMGARIRDVRQGPDGAVYMVTDQSNGAVLRLAPARR